MEKSTETQTLSDLFQIGFNAVQKVEDMTPSDKGYRNIVEEAIEKLEECTRLVNQLGLFSVNETADEIPTAHLKVLLIPALLSVLVSKKEGDRSLLIEQSAIYLKDYLKRCTDYGFTEWRDKDPEETPKATDLRQAAKDRDKKIERYDETNRLLALQSEVEKRIEAGSALEEEVRSYYLNLIKYWCIRALDDLDLVEQEAAILKYMKGPTDKPSISDQKAPRAPMKPFMITKSNEQKKVFGAGYPSLPVLTVDEFYQQKYGNAKKEADNHGAGHSLQSWAQDPVGNQNDLESEAAEKETKVELDDPTELARMRAWDDWKDEHRRGEGNRKNMG